MPEGVPEVLGVGSLLIGGVAGLVFGAFAYATGPGRRLRYWLRYRGRGNVLRSGQAVVAVRVVAGSQVGLTGSWCRATATARPGQLVLTRHVGGLALFKRPVPPVQLIALGDVERLRPGDSLRLDPDSDVMPLRTPTGMLQLAVLPPLPGERVRARLHWPGAPYC